MTRPISRRTFVRTAAASASLLAAPAVLTAGKTPAKQPIIGDGDYRYECIHDWGAANLPADHHYGNASHGVTFDREGHVYITHYGKPASIFVFDAEGKFVKSLGDFDTKGGHGCGHGIDIRYENDEPFLYLSPSESSMAFHKMAMNGELVWSIGKDRLIEETGKYKGNSRYRPTNISFSPDGGFFLGDGYGSNYIHQYNADGKYIRTIGGTGTGDGQFKTPHGQWLDDRDGTPKLAVCDRANARLQWFDMDGEHLRTQDGFLFPADIDTRGELMVVPDLHARVTLLDKNNNVLTHLGGHGDFEAWKKAALHKFQMRNQRNRWQGGRFVHPHDAAFDAEGNIFVTEWVKTGRVTKLRRIR